MRAVLANPRLPLWQTTAVGLSILLAYGLVSSAWAGTIVVLLAGGALVLVLTVWLPPQIFLFVISFIPAFAAVYFGSSAVSFGIDWLNSNAPWILRGFEIAGGLLPAIGIALNMRFIFRGTVWPWFFVGFIVSATTNGGINIFTLGVIGVALAALHVYFLGDRAEKAMQPRGA